MFPRLVPLEHLAVKCYQVVLEVWHSKRVWLGLWSR